MTNWPNPEKGSSLLQEFGSGGAIKSKGISQLPNGKDLVHRKPPSEEIKHFPLARRRVRPPRFAIASKAAGVMEMRIIALNLGDALR